MFFSLKLCNVNKSYWTLNPRVGNYNAINSLRERGGTAQIPRAGIKMILLTLTVLLTSKIVAVFIAKARHVCFS